MHGRCDLHGLSDLNVWRLQLGSQVTDRTETLPQIRRVPQNRNREPRQPPLSPLHRNSSKANHSEAVGAFLRRLRISAGRS